MDMYDYQWIHRCILYKHNVICIQNTYSSVIPAFFFLHRCMIIVIWRVDSLHVVLDKMSVSMLRDTGIQYIDGALFPREVALTRLKRAEDIYTNNRNRGLSATSCLTCIRL